MCGIAGFWSSGRFGLAHGEAMASRLEHRGPDDAGAWQDAEAGLVLAHRRLAIMDLSPAGHQPMHSPCGRYALVYNGEIYNHLELRQELAAQGGAFDWEGHADTETLLAALIRWGVKGALGRLNGMFAFALWDARERVLYLARDRLGEKPLYYGRSGSTFLFGSELKALTAHPDWQGVVDRDALTLYMRHRYIPTPWCIYQGIRKLPPASCVTVRGGSRDISEPEAYWSLAEVAERGVATQGDDPDGLVDEMDALLRDAMARRMAADVPLGAFLSGGYDSTLVTAVMQSLSETPVKTFTIGFHEKGYDEAVDARAVADYLGTEHTELYVTPEQALSVIPELPRLYDEPFADSSQIPTYLVTQLARQDVTVSLSGDGGDELFYGYRRYFKADGMWTSLGRFPLPVRKLAANMVSLAPAGAIERVMRLLPAGYRVNHLEDRLPIITKILGSASGSVLYREMVSHDKDPGRLVLGAKEPDTVLNKPGDLPNLPGLREQMMYLDMVTYLPDDILTKVDRASMAVGLEARVPLLDHRLVEFAWRVPTRLKCHGGKGKWLMRQLLYRYVPESLVDRPKKGFGVPLDHWLRGPLREWAAALLDEKRLEEEGFFDPAPIREMWEEHLSGKHDWHYYLWDVLMFQAWWEEQARTANNNHVSNVSTGLYTPRVSESPICD